MNTGSNSIRRSAACFVRLASLGGLPRHAGHAAGAAKAPRQTAASGFARLHCRDRGADRAAFADLTARWTRLGAAGLIDGDLLSCGCNRAHEGGENHAREPIVA